MSYEHVPKNLKSLPQWVCFRTVPRDNGKLAKIPVNPKTLTDAKANDPGTWATFDEAVAALQRYPERLAGIGIEFANGIFGVDLDGVINEAGQITAEAADIVATMDSYTEYSPSGTGLHILCKGSIPPGKRRKGAFEIYENGRFFTVTGKPYGPTRAFAERTRQAATVHRRYIDPPAAAPATVQPNNSPWSDDELLSKMFTSKQGAEIKRLFDGDLSAHGGDHSAADMALVNHLCYWTNGDEWAIERLFRRSGLMRDKWDRRDNQYGTYGNRTIQTALKNFTPYSGPVYTYEQARRDFDDLDAPPSSPVGSPPPVVAPFEKKSAADLVGDFMAKVQSDLYKPIPTGFKHLDDALAGGLLTKSFVLIGAASSMGKTTFAQQMVESMAAAYGRDVVYFPLEMSVDALLAKSISRLSFELTQDSAQALTSAQVMQGYKWGELTQEQRAALQRAGDYIKRRHSSVYYADLPNAQAETILATAERYTEPGKPAPFIVLDYIQLLQGGQSEDAAGTIKRATKALHDYAIRNNTIVFAITAFNREATKGGKAQLESARDTSDLEYSMDYGFYFNFWDNENPKELDKSKDGRPIILPRDELIRDKPRRVSVKLIKNRLGPTGETVGFKYHAAFNYFESASHADMKDAYTTARLAAQGITVSDSNDFFADFDDTDE